jgi:hypothetical protein
LASQIAEKTVLHSNPKSGHSFEGFQTQNVETKQIKDDIVMGTKNQKNTNDMSHVNSISNENENLNEVSPNLNGNGEQKSVIEIEKDAIDLIQKVQTNVKNVENEMSKLQSVKVKLRSLSQKIEVESQRLRQERLQLDKEKEKLEMEKSQFKNRVLEYENTKRTKVREPKKNKNQKNRNLKDFGDSMEDYSEDECQDGGCEDDWD